VEDPQKIEFEVNKWIKENESASVSHIGFFPVAMGQNSALMVTIIYGQENWR
jgi:hypothetical protein